MRSSEARYILLRDTKLPLPQGKAQRHTLSQQISQLRKIRGLVIEYDKTADAYMLMDGDSITRRAAKKRMVTPKQAATTAAILDGTKKEQPGFPVYILQVLLLALSGCCLLIVIINTLR